MTSVAMLGILLVLGSAAFVVYTYVGYPLLLQALSTVRSRAVARESPDEWPEITITIPAYNEEGSIRDTLEHVLALDYPEDRRHVLVISDASTDRTDEIVREYADRGVTLVRLAKRSGKTTAENAARTHLRGEIVVNVDASVRPDPGALKALVAAFAEPAVGIASGRDVSVGRDEADPNIGEAGYVGYEMWVRDLETVVGGIVGASGCFYASRAALHMEIVPAALSRDFAAPLIAKEHGFRAVAVPEAVCFVPRARSLRSEYRRKVRTMARGLDTLRFKRHLLNPLRYGTFAWMLLSHKLARWLVPWSVLIGSVGVLLLGFHDPTVWWVGGAGGIAVVVAMAVAWWWPFHSPMPKVLRAPAYIVFGILAGLHAWSKALRRELNPIWEPTRR